MKKEDKDKEGKCHRFGKGNKFGQGRPKLSPEEKKLRKLTKTKFREMIHVYLYMTDEQRKQNEEDPETVALERMLLKSLNNAIDDGDVNKIEWFLNQFFGTPSSKGTKVELSTEGDTGKRTTVILNIPSNGREKV